MGGNVGASVPGADVGVVGPEVVGVGDDVVPVGELVKVGAGVDAPGGKEAEGADPESDDAYDSSTVPGVATDRNALEMPCATSSAVDATASPGTLAVPHLNTTNPVTSVATSCGEEYQSTNGVDSVTTVALNVTAGWESARARDDPPPPDADGADVGDSVVEVVGEPDEEVGAKETTGAPRGVATASTTADTQ